MVRNNAVVFAKYAQWMFERINNDQANLHHKFFGVILVEALASQVEGVLMTALPMLAQAMKSAVAELRQAGMLAVSQLSSTTSLSREYVHAFVRQILITATHNPTDVEQALQTLLLVAQYQNACVLNKQDVVLLSGLSRATKTLENLASKFDVSKLVSLMLEAVVSDQPLECAEATKWLSKVVTSTKIMNLKVSFSAVTCLLQRVVLLISGDQTAYEARLKPALSLLELLMKNNLQVFN